MGEATQDLMKLCPVLFTYKSDAEGRLQFGLIAEEVAEVYPRLVSRSANGEIQGVRHHLLSSMLLNELQKQHQALQEKDAQIANLETRLTALEKAVAQNNDASLPISSAPTAGWLLFGGLALGGVMLAQRRRL